MLAWGTGVHSVLGNMDSNVWQRKGVRGLVQFQQHVL